jgi:hypothetical protein
MGANFWATKKSGNWVVRKQGSDRIASTHTTQSDAWAETRRLARGAGGDAYLRDGNGNVRARNTYGKDTSSSKG